MKLKKIKSNKKTEEENDRKGFIFNVLKKHDILVIAFLMVKLC